jgi:hypothetical protein
MKYHRKPERRSVKIPDSRSSIQFKNTAPVTGCFAHLMPAACSNEFFMSVIGRFLPFQVGAKAIN